MRDEPDLTEMVELDDQDTDDDNDSIIDSQEADTDGDTFSG